MYSFRAVLICLTLAMITFWAYKFSLNNDLCLVDYKSYGEDTDDVYPMLSVCLNNPFLIQNLHEYGSEINETSYLDHLRGEIFSEKLMAIDYDNVTSDLNKYVQPYYEYKYYIQRTNGSVEYYPIDDKNKHLFRVTYGGFWFTYFYKCFAHEIPHDKSIQGVSIHLRNEIFPPGIKRNGYEFFTLLHYPNQVLLSVHTIKYE